MSEKQKKPLSGASGPEANDSVFDFLYHDANRIGSFLGQFDPSGVSQSLKRTNQVSKGTNEQANNLLNINAGLAKAQIGDRGGSSISSQQSAETIFDPLWANARAFLDYIVQKDLVTSNLYGAHIGQFVLFSGGLSVVDTGVMKQAYSLPMFRRVSGIPDPSVKHKGQQKAPNELEFAFEMLGILPHSAHATVSSPSASVWASLNQDCLTIPTADLLLKHGLSIPGEWSVVGILDAQPDIVESSEVVPNADGAGAIALLMQLIAPIARKILGRPEDSFGVTPLLIFREVQAGANGGH